MYASVSTDGARSVVVMPAHTGIPTAARIWLLAYAGMTSSLSIRAPGRAYNLPNTLQASGATRILTDAQHAERSVSLVALAIYHGQSELVVTCSRVTIASEP
jgi:hypothetical protein